MRRKPKRIVCFVSGMLLGTILVTSLTNEKHIIVNNNVNKIEAISKFDIVPKQKQLPKVPEIEKEEVNNNYLGSFYLTGYCNCEICCGEWAGGPTASGAYPIEGVTIAVDTSVIPLGTHVIIDGHEYIAQDTGSAIKGNKIDMYMGSHDACFNSICNGWHDVYLVGE